MTDDENLDALRDATSTAATILTAPRRRTAALAYLQQRGIPTEAIPSDWPLGYAPPGWTGLVDQLSRTYPDDVLLTAGLARRSSRGTLIDTFRDRVIFPIHDRDGHVAGFVGRDLSGAPDAPKYLNTARTPLYDKSALLYGLHEGQQTAGQVVVVEGPLDVLAIVATQAARGDDARFRPVASCGTAFTAAHANLVAQTGWNEPCVVAMDGDAAGRSAATSAGELLRQACVEVKVAVLPNGLDPAAYLARPGADLGIFDAARALPLLTFTVERAIAAQGDRMQWVEGRVAAARSIASYLTTYPVHYSARQIGWISHALDVDPATLTTELASAYSITRTPDRAAPAPAAAIAI